MRTIVSCAVLSSLLAVAALACGANVSPPAKSEQAPAASSDAPAPSAPAATPTPAPNVADAKPEAPATPSAAASSTPAQPPSTAKGCTKPSGAPCDDGPGTRSATQVERGIAAARPRVRACFQGGKAPAKILAQMVIAPSGKVTKLELGGIPKGPLATCVDGVLRSISFDPASDESKVNVPFIYDSM
jgi:hypothetical protein